ncbi:MAG: S8 family serine peptidase, partial [Rhodospirillales bacterium]|nr:S8 family serine peptidase [Rhodospirillales bacterium]
MLVLLAATSTAQAQIADHLDIIGWDEVQADSRFTGISGAGQSIAIFDTGVDETHFFFGGRNVSGINFAANPPTSPDPAYSDNRGHGSFVASVAAGNTGFLNNLGIEVGGVARQADIVSVRVLDNNGNGSFDDIIDGMDWVIDQVTNFDSDIRVVNMSLGTTNTFISQPSGTIVNEFNARVDTLTTLGIPVIAASGNSGSQTGLSFPAISDSVIAVGSSNLNDTVSSFTNRNNELDLLAPGDDIWGAFIDLGDPSNDTTVSLGSGTSFAAPLVSGSILLINEVYEDRWGRAPTTEELLDSFNKGYACIKGRFGHRFLMDKNRPESAGIKTNGTAEKV